MPFLVATLYLAWACWLGSMVFFSFVVAPTVHGTLERPDAAKLMQRMFPRYYMFGLIAAAAGIASALIVANDFRITVPLVIGAVFTTYARQVITPSLLGAREAADEVRFKRLHVLSVRMNMATMAALLLVGAMLVML